MKLLMQLQSTSHTFIDRGTQILRVLWEHNVRSKVYNSSLNQNLSIWRSLFVTKRCVLFKSTIGRLNNRFYYRTIKTNEKSTISLFTSV